MSSLHPSRGRVMFDAACALGIAGSCVFAWMQTYATAFLPMAGITGLYGLVHLFGMRGSSASDRSEDVVVPEYLPENLVTVQPEPVPEDAPAYVQPPIDEVIASVKRSRKSPKKTKSRPIKEVAAPESPMLVQEVPVALDAPAPVAEPEPTTAEVVQHPAHIEAEEAEHEYAPAVVPLFEAEPFVRTARRAAFGRKAG